MERKRPGGPLSTRPLHLIYICDCSGSMAVDGKIQSLNNVMWQVTPLMREAASGNPNVQMLIRVIRFSDGAQWQVAQPTPVQEFEWTDLVADGVTDMGKALTMVADQLDISKMSDRALPPVLVLISDGHPSDDFKTGLKQLNAQPWGKKAVRIAIAIGRDADQEILQEFIGNPELKVLTANSPDALLNRIKWVSTVVIKDVSAIPNLPATELDGSAAPIHWTVPELNATVTDVW